MEKKMTKKLLAILMIITILSADFFVLGSNLITYATELNSETSNTNVEFSAYLNSQTKDNNLTGSIKDNNLKLYAEIKVNSDDGYLAEGASIQIENSNFNLKNEILSTNTHIASIEENKVNLKQINNGETVKIELGIEPIISENITTDFLSKVSTVKMSGTYIYSQAENGETVSAEKEVCLNYQPDETIGAELDAEIITNKVLAVKGENKRVVQILVKSRLTNNEYPVEQTTLNVEMPDTGEIVPEISVMAIDELATNGLTSLGDGDFTRNGQNIQIVIKNEANSANEIKWKKNAYDELVITYLYPADMTAAQVSTGSVSSQIKLYGVTNPYTINDFQVRVNELVEETSQVIIGKTEITTGEMFKGKIYANIEEQYNTKTSIIVTNANIVEEIVVNENKDTYVTTENELPVNSKYVTTEVNLEKMLEILGQDGNIEIKNGEVSTLIDKESTVNENGNVVITHNPDTSTSELVITTNKPVATGILEINHTKVITGNTYTREQLQKVTSLKANGSLLGTITVNKEKQNIVEISTETSNSSIELKETKTKAELTIENNKNILSTTEANNVILGITLVTDGTQYDLYKNAEINLQFPEAVEKVTLNSNPIKQNADEFKINAKYDSQNKIIQIKFEGEQTSYPESELKQAYLQLDLGITMSKLATTQKDKIIMTYTNENASVYEGETTESGVYEQEVQVSAPNGVIKMFNVSTNENTSLTENIKQAITEENAGEVLKFETILVNNLETDMNNVRILGKLPTTDDAENTLETVLKSINALNATVYYTEDASADINNENVWTETYTNNAKMYLINLGTLSKGDNYTATVEVQIPSSIENGVISYTEYKVIYDTETTTNIEETSRKITLATSVLQIDFTAQVGQKKLNNGDVIKEGEVIKYIATVKNNTEQAIENIELKSDVSEGTVVVKPIEDYEYFLNRYYEEATDVKEISETISVLPAGETYTMQYEVRVNTNITTGTEISNKIKATYNNKIIESQELVNKLEESNIRVTIKKAIDESIKLTSGSEVQYDVMIENLSNERISGLDMEIISDNFILESEELVLGEIAANSTLNIKLNGNIKADAEEMQISVIVTEANNKYNSNVVEEKLIQADATINLTTPQNNTTLKEGDLVEYNITVENTGNVAEYFKVYYSLSDDFTIQSVNINGNTIAQTTDKTNENTYCSIISNLIYEGMNLEVGGKGIINIIAKVNGVEETKQITNKAKVEVLNVYKDESQEIAHTLQIISSSDDTTEPEGPTNPDKPTNPEDPTNPTEPESNKIISGLAWKDLNRNGQKDISDSVLPGIKVRVYDVSTEKYLVDNNGNIVEVQTDANGKYLLNNIEKGSYILIFEYDEKEYEPTKYCADGVDTTRNSKVVLKKINIDGKEITATVTDIIDVQENISNINIGLREKLIFDLELNKYITKMVVQTNKETKSYNYENSTFEKVEIHKKQIQGALVVLEYTIKIKNTGEIPGYAKNIVDYIPSGLTFSSELNKDWYLSGSNVYTKSLENVELKPGEEKEVKLILTKTMTSENLGLINNRAEIQQDYNTYGEADIDSTPNNQVQNEDDFGTVDVIIQVATGGSITVYIILMIINLVLIGIAISIMIKNNIIKISTKKGRR